MNETSTILQVVVGDLSSMQAVELKARFGSAYNVKIGRVEYVAAHESHAVDVFQDEFLTPEVPTDFAAILRVPGAPESFVPFTEDSSGWCESEWDGANWIAVD